ncbi:hydantoinase/oxoprolinase family protein [Microbacterium marinilacus]|uniref:Hydantoinase/oxoprolinase family protein n=1 Tax=Microbacterium marinilacus TaxID=415209 RepID=A0ABP7BNL3_9MICO|nr:hydantoinase/oxoprolinase family protein [Microbacterium marinilacus]MBY0689799.1 hydantoinase/oxoprolinase family protein [Microbacterium marinilacus]
MRVGVDIGGTFTDITAVDRDGVFHIGKIPSTLGDQSIALADGVRGVLARSGARPEQVSYLGHGTTVATNTLLELDGSSTALVVTRGFRDVLEIARQKRPSLYDLFADKPRVLVPRRLVFELDERILGDGSELRAVADDDLARLLDELGAVDVESVAICFLHSYRDPRHEEQVAAAVSERFPDRYVTRSSEVAPEFREYERLSTTVINAFVGPRMHRYVSRLEERTRELGVPVAPKIIQSNGGIVSPDSIVRRPVTTLLSGPSAGVLGAAWIAGQSGYGDLVTFDMGGTSTDVCLVRDGRALVASERSIDGYVVRTPSANVHTVGAGGGSIAQVDGAGALHVGPRSAGAVPGPAAYGHGGTVATVTDANVVLGRQNPDQVIGEGLRLDVRAARSVVGAVGERLGLNEPDAALGIVRVANSHMARAVRGVSVDNGDDPRDLALVAYGGAGPLHAVEVAREVGMRTVIVPPNPGTLCALGLLVSEVRTEIRRSGLIDLDGDVAPLRALIAELRDAADEWFERERIPTGERRTGFVLDMRYQRQNFELPVDIGDGRLDDDDLPAIVDRFHEVHRKSYGFAHPDAPVRVVNVTVVAAQPIEEPRPSSLPERTAEDTPSVVARRVLRFPDGEREADIHRRELLRAGDVVRGPAVVEQEDSTTVLPPGATGEVDRFGTLIVEVGA